MNKLLNVLQLLTPRMPICARIKLRILILRARKLISKLSYVPWLPYARGKNTESALVRKHIAHAQIIIRRQEQQQEQHALVTDIFSDSTSPSPQAERTRGGSLQPQPWILTDATCASRTTATRPSRAGRRRPTPTTTTTRPASCGSALTPCSGTCCRAPRRPADSGTSSTTRSSPARRPRRRRH